MHCKLSANAVSPARSETEVYILTGFPLAADSYIARTMASRCRADSPLTYGSRSSSMA